MSNYGIAKSQILGIFYFLWRFVIAFSSINSDWKTWLMLAAWNCSSFFFHFLLSWLDLVEVSFQGKYFSSEKSPCQWLICTLPNPGSLYWPEIFFVPSLYKIFLCMKTFWLRTYNYWLKLLLFNYKTDWRIFALICSFTFSGKLGGFTSTIRLNDLIPEYFLVDSPKTPESRN